MMFNIFALILKIKKYLNQVYASNMILYFYGIIDGIDCAKCMNKLNRKFLRIKKYEKEIEFENINVEF